MQNGNLSLPFFHNDRLVVELLTFADATSDDAETQHAARRAMEARDALKQARAEHAQAARVKRDVPKRVLADLAGAPRPAPRPRTRPSAAASGTSPTSACVTAKTQRANILNDFLARPLDIDPISDRLDKGERLRRLEAINPEERSLMLVSAAREGTHPESLRAALTNERPPWPTGDLAAVTRRRHRRGDPRVDLCAWSDPQTVRDARAAWRLRRLSYDLDRDAEGFPLPGHTAADLIFERPAAGAAR